MNDANRQYVRQVHMSGEEIVTLCGCCFAHWQFYCYILSLQINAVIAPPSVLYVPTLLYAA